MDDLVFGLGPGARPRFQARVRSDPPQDGPLAHRAPAARAHPAQAPSYGTRPLRVGRQPGPRRAHPLLRRANRPCGPRGAPATRIASTSASTRWAVARSAAISPASRASDNGRYVDRRVRSTKARAFRRGSRVQSGHVHDPLFVRGDSVTRAGACYADRACSTHSPSPSSSPPGASPASRPKSSSPRRSTTAVNRESTSRPTSSGPGLAEDRSLRLRA